MKTIAKLGFQTALVIIAGFGIVSSALAGETVSTPSERKTIQARCFERSDLLFDLARELGERLSQTKRVGDNGLLEAFTSPTEGTWTIVYSDGDKRSCIIASGDGLPVSLDSLDEEDARVPKRTEATI